MKNVKITLTKDKNDSSVPIVAHCLCLNTHSCLMVSLETIINYDTLITFLNPRRPWNSARS